MTSILTLFDGMPCILGSQDFQQKEKGFNFRV